jgi:hypothetical protein
VSEEPAPLGPPDPEVELAAVQVLVAALAIAETERNPNFPAFVKAEFDTVLGEMSLPQGPDARTRLRAAIHLLLEPATGIASLLHEGAAEQRSLRRSLWSAFWGRKNDNRA